MWNQVVLRQTIISVFSAIPEYIVMIRGNIQFVEPIKLLFSIWRVEVLWPWKTDTTIAVLSAQ